MNTLKNTCFQFKNNDEASKECLRLGNLKYKNTCSGVDGYFYLVDEKGFYGKYFMLDTRTLIEPSEYLALLTEKQLTVEDEPKELTQNLFKKSEPIEHDCIIAVDEKGNQILLKSNPSLYEHDIFDGNDLNDNVNNSKQDIPKECGVYRCKIMVHSYSYWTDCGTEYDMNVWIEDVVKLDILRSSQSESNPYEKQINKIVDDAFEKAKESQPETVGEQKKESLHAQIARKQLQNAPV